MYTPEAIGTPLTPTALKVLLLGASELGRELAIALQRLGVEVHAADRYVGAPAHHVANKAHVLDIYDGESIRRLVQEVRPHFIVPDVESLPADVLQEIEAEGVASVVPTALANRLTMNREGIRTFAHDKLGLPNSAFRFASTPEEMTRAAEEIGYPCVVKPVMGSSGAGQSYVGGADELEAAWNEAMKNSRFNVQRVMVEQYIPFDYEVTILAVRSIDPATGREATWFCEPIGHRQDRGDYVESWQPAHMSEDALDTARSIAARIATALGGRGVFGVELFVKGDDVYFSEVSPRPHDTGMVTLGTQRFSEFDLHARAILGLPIDTTLISPGASAVIRCEDRADGDIEYVGVNKAMAVEETNVYLFGKPRALTRRRMGVTVATAEDINQARQRAEEAAGYIKVRPTVFAEDGQ
ncbi:formate-dependent phosphoribosylglycinamide formyltransferase [Corynebacterium sp. c9Ua_112]|uniref:Formate-dependent phosphoribosylglycinamide formyltransferase n=1 Tax=Corynebacterium macclintockiae TaxID=2913501 RepID=A0A9X3RRF4_9CORY|nr:formate-dependent phosphoribosylglycinamide formyltransferase [Corynebacterium macclintockiae]MCZ9304957.1 formate-dependent phosphoribosylglycinamide formyltransferase [Corynebacterium macclintockiae]